MKMFKVTKRHIELAQLGLSVLEESFNKAQHDEHKAHNEDAGFANVFSRRHAELVSRFGPYSAGKQMIHEIMDLTVCHPQFARESTATESFKAAMVDAVEEAIEMAVAKQ